MTVDERDLDICTAVESELVTHGLRDDDATSFVDGSSHTIRMAYVLPPAQGSAQAAAAVGSASTPRRYCPVDDSSTSATSSGVPVAITSPPSSPPPGPRSTIQSACLMTSRLCSITSTVLPLSTSRCS